MNNSFFRIGAAVIALALLAYGFSVYQAESGQVALVPGETVSLVGNVVSVNMEQAAYDGPYLVTLQTKQAGQVVVAVPSMGLPLCEAYKAKNIGEVSLITVGNEFEVRGEVAENGSVVPCVSADHYLRPTPVVVDGFEGEADPARMTLGMKSWKWVSATYGDGRTLMPKTDRFSVTFADDGRFSVTTDCNSMGGSYVVGAGGALTLGEMFSTKMYCEGSQEADFAQLLGETSKYRFTSKGELILDLKAGGNVVLR